MKVMYEASKGHRSKSGRFKASNGRSYPVIDGISIKTSTGENMYYHNDFDRWVSKEDRETGWFSGWLSSNYGKVRSLKDVKSHIKRHTEIPKGSLVTVSSRIPGNNIYIRVKK